MVQIRNHERHTPLQAAPAMSSCCGGDGRRLSHKYRYLDRCCWRLVTAITVVVVSLTTHVRSNVKVVQAWTVTPSCNRNSRICYSDKWNRRLPPPPPPQTVVRMMADSDIEDIADVDVVDDDDSIGMSTSSVTKDMKLMERVWRYNKKPLLSIGAQKGPTVKHGNSLRELLNHHTTVKVKIQLLLNSSSRNNDAQTMEDQMIINNNIKHTHSRVNSCSTYGKGVKYPRLT